MYWKLTPNWAHRVTVDGEKVQSGDEKGTEYQKTPKKPPQKNPKKV